MHSKYLYLLFVFLVLTGCRNQTTVTEEPTDPVQTPVTVTGVTGGPMTESIELNATSTFLLKNFVKANANGYLQSSAVTPGQYVNAGQILFTIKTKEAESIGNAINKLDSTFKFSGINTIKSGAKGYISQVNHQPGDYVQDGEQLAVINDATSFIFLLELPYELKPYVKLGSRTDVQLPDGEKIPGVISSYMPTVEAVSQTQGIVIKINTGRMIPENLTAKIRIPKIVRENAISLPRSSVLSDETQSTFWVMKMTDSVTAVKVPVKKGIENNERIEILSPLFTSSDKFILTGNYGLGDTARVRIVQP
jgi:multidrug efflux pump subunit AcrA (membrane-fusion protein)